VKIGQVYPEIICLGFIL